MRIADRTSAIERWEFEEACQRYIHFIILAVIIWKFLADYWNTFQQFTKGKRKMIALTTYQFILVFSKKASFAFVHHSSP